MYNTQNVNKNTNILTSFVALSSLGRVAGCRDRRGGDGDDAEADDECPEHFPLHITNL